jgi:hypothetical protein
MISEGTRVSPEEAQVIHSEQSVKAESNEVIAKASKIAIVASTVETSTDSKLFTKYAGSRLTESEAKQSS